MERQNRVILISAFCFYTVMPSVSSVFDLAKSFLSTAVDTLGEGISLTSAFDATLRQGFKIHSSITGHNSFAKLNGDLGGDFKPALQQAYTKHTQQDAQIRVSAELCDQEKNFVEQRIVLAHDSFQALCNDYGVSADQLSSSNMPRVALCASGGGCRAMLATAGFFDALESTTNTSGAKLLDLALYVAVLSGSTWATIPRSFGLAQKKCFDTYEKYVQFTPDVLSKTARQNHTQLPALTGATSQELVVTPDSQAIVVRKDASVSSSLSLTECINFSKRLDPAKSYLLPHSGPKPSDDNKYDEMSYIQNNIMLKFYADQNITAMSPYGAFLSHMLGAPFDDPGLNNMENSDSDYYPQPRQRLFLSQAADYLEENNCKNFPLPLASAISPRRQKTFLAKMVKALTSQQVEEDFLWFEFSPYEVGTIYKGSRGAFVPTWAFGRKFYKVPQYETVPEHKIVKKKFGSITQRGGSASQSNTGGGVTEQYSVMEYVKKQKGIILSSNKDGSPVAPYTYVSEYPVGDLLATWGSAFAVSPADIVRIMGVGNYSQSHPYFTRIMKAMSQALQFTPVGSAVSGAYNNFRLFPFTTFNFLKLLEDSPCKDTDLVLVDAGLECNIPWPLALHPERKIDVVIALDASAPVYTVDKNGNKKVDTLVGAQQWAARNNISFPEIVKDGQYQKIMQTDSSGRSPQDIFIFEGKGIAPTIIYVPFLDNPANQGSAFKVSQCMQGECSTFNFGYKKETIESIRKHIYNTLHTGDNIKKILQAIADKIGSRD